MSRVMKNENGFISEYEGEGLQLIHSVRVSAIVGLSRVPPENTAWRGALKPTTYVGVTGGSYVFHADPSDILALIANN